MITTVKLIHLAAWGVRHEVESMQLDDEQDWNDAGEIWRKQAQKILGPTYRWVHAKDQIFGGYYRNDVGQCLVME